MATKSPIEWTDHTMNFWVGCNPVSPGCANCYMVPGMKRAGRDPYTVVRTADATWRQPLRKGKHAWQPGARVFVESWGDFCHPAADEWRADAWDVMRQRPDLTWLILTKRADRLAHCLPGDWDDPWPNVAFGVTVENQETFSQRWPWLADIEAAWRFLSYEPALGPLEIDMALALECHHCYCRKWLRYDADSYCADCGEPLVAADWVILGGESGPGARPMHPDWARRLRHVCVEAGVPFFFKQWGAWIPTWGHETHLVYRDGRVVEGTHEHPDAWKHHIAEPMVRVGKKRAGRLLNGQVWAQTPWGDE